MKINIQRDIPPVRNLPPGTKYRTRDGMEYMRISGEDENGFPKVLHLGDFVAIVAGGLYRPHEIIECPDSSVLEQTFQLTLTRRELQMLEWDLRNSPVNRSRSASDSLAWEEMYKGIHNALNP